MHQIVKGALLGLLAVTLISFKVNAQQITIPDSLVQKTAAQNLEAHFNKAIKQQSKLFNGAFYEFYLPRITGSAYFKDSQEFTKGSVVYDGFLYEDVPLLYDMYRDVVVSVFYEGNFKFSLISEKVTEFKIDNHHFVYVDKGLDSTKSVGRTGFYDRLYNGKVKIYSKRTRLLQEATDSRYARQFFVPKNFYYVEKDKMLHSFASLGSFLSLFKKEKSEMRKYLKKNEIRYKDNPERAMVLLASYYDTLLN